MIVEVLTRHLDESSAINRTSSITVSPWRAFLTAVGFLTRVPLGCRDVSPAMLERSVAFFPLVGSLIGAFTAAVIVAGSSIWPPVLCVVVALAAEALLTGAFHEDALADFADAFGGGWEREQTLRILKDPRHGTFGVMALLLGVSMRAAAILAILSSDPGRPSVLDASVALVASAAVGRWLIVFTMWRLPPVAGRDGLANDFGQPTAMRDVLLGGLFTLPGVAPLAWWMPIPCLIGLAALAVIVVWFQRLVSRRLGGVTGDCLGSICYIGQVIVLLAAANGMGIEPGVG